MDQVVLKVDAKQRGLVFDPRRAVAGALASRVVFVDSTGMGAIVAGYNAAKGAGVRFDVQEVAPFVADQLGATGLYELLIRRWGWPGNRRQRAAPVVQARYTGGHRR